jgi:hypothetical protein
VNEKFHTDPLTESNPSFWRKKLATSLGVDPSLDDEFLLSAHNKNLAWRKKAADAIGASPNLSDAELLKKHSEHMETMKALQAFTADENGSMVRAGMPPGPAAAAQNERATALENERTRTKLVQTLVANEQRDKGLTYEAAWDRVRRTHPTIFAAMTNPVKP